MMSSFDFFGRYEAPELILCNPDDTEIGVITNADDLRTNICLSDISDISYKIYETDNPTYNSMIYDKHIERRQIHAIGIGYFIITSCMENEDESGKYKQITAKSCENELNNIAMPYINGTYQLYKPENFDSKSNEEIANQNDEYLNENCLLYEIMKVIPSWTLGGQSDLAGMGTNHSDEMKKKYKELAESFRTFEYSDTTVYSFLVKELQDSYGCFVYFDIENRKIYILHQEDVFDVLPMVISEANILDSCVVSTTIDSYVNTLSVEGTEGVSIASINPLGNSMIYNFDHDINTGLIEGELKDLLEYWKNSVRNSAVYTGSYFPPDIVQMWAKAPSRVSKFQYSLIDEIGKGEEGDISSVLNAEDYLMDIGLSDEERLRFKEALKDAADEAITTNKEDDGSINTVNIENLFFKIGRYRINLLIPQTVSTNMSVAEINKFLHSTQELRAGIQSELKSLESYKNGYDAQYEALKVTATDGSEKAENAKTEQLEIVNDYKQLIETSKTTYDEVFINVESIIKNINDILSELYSDNGFETSFKRYYENVLKYDDELAEERAFKMYANLTRYIKQQTYTDDTIVVTDVMSIDEKFTQESDLYNSAVSLLEKISVPEYEVSVSAESFLFSEEYENIIAQLNIRSSIYVEIPNGDVPLFHLLKISITYNEPSCEFTFGNRIRLSDPTSVFSDLQRTATSAANIVATERINWGINEEKINELMSLKNADIDTTYRIMSNSVNKTTMGNDGFKCYAIDGKGNQSYGMWCANGVMMFLDVDKDTGMIKPQMAIGRMLKADGSSSYGFYGQSIIANSITADKFTAGAVSKGTNYIRNGSFEGFANTGGLYTLNGWTSNDAGLMSLSKNIHTPVGKTVLIALNGLAISQSISEALPAGEYVLSFYATNNTKAPILGFNTTINDDMGNQIVVCSVENNREDVKGFEESNWTRSFIKFTLEKAVTNAVLTISNNSGSDVLIDGFMLEKSQTLNEYSPHISEVYAKYTTIDDSGIIVYDGRIRILNQAGVETFGADENGDLHLTGIISAQAGGDIAGWQIGEKEIYKENDDNVMRISSSGDRIFSFRNSEKEVFYVDNNGKLFADGAEISGRIDANEGEIGAWTIDGNSLNNNSKGELILNNGLYTTKFDGYGIYGGKNGAWGMSVTMAESSGGANGTWNGIINNIFSDSSKTYDNLALAGREEIFFGLRPNGTYKEAGKIYWNSGLFNEYPIFKIEAIQANRIVIDGVVYYVNAFTDAGLVSALNPLGRYLGLTTLY